MKIAVIIEVIDNFFCYFYIEFEFSLVGKKVNKEIGDDIKIVTKLKISIKTFEVKYVKVLELKLFYF